MSQLFFDRVSRTRVEEIETGGSVLGQWLVEKAPADGLFQNSIPAAAGDYLVPDASGSWSILTADGRRYEGGMTRAYLSDLLESESVRSLGRRLAELMVKEAGGSEFLRIIPLVPGMSEEIRLQKLDPLIKESLGFLKLVCSKPRTNLQVEIERVPVSRARRVTSGASSYLAGHTEDWDHVLVRGVLPKRILAEVRDEQVNIYENRVVARLIDHLSFYLTSRIQRIKKLIRIFTDKENYSGQAGGTYLRIERISTLWGDSVDADEGRKTAEASLKYLEWMKYEFMGLMDTRLYRDIPRKAFVPPALRLTNILVNDQNYIKVANLWREWADSGCLKTETPKERYQAQQELCKGFDSFVFLLAMKAIKQLGFELEDDPRNGTVRPDSCMKFSGYGLSVDLEWEDRGATQLRSGPTILRLIPLAINFSAGIADSQVAAVIQRLQSRLSATSESTVFVFLGSESEASVSLSDELLRKLHSIGNDPRLVLDGRFGFFPVSPWDICSVERVSRAFRWVLDSARYLGYPFEVPFDRQAPPDLQRGIADGWLEPSPKGVQLNRPPQAFEIQKLGLDNQINESANALKRVEQEHEHLSERLRSAVREGKTGSLNPMKKAALQSKILAQKKHEALITFEKSFLSAQSLIRSLMQCPVCRTDVDPGVGFEARGGGTFQACCSDCGAIWGTRRCSNNHKFSVMLPDDWIDIEDMFPGWEDKVYGSDLLALPAKTKNGEWGFVCPECGVVTV